MSGVRYTKKKQDEIVRLYKRDEKSMAQIAELPDMPSVKTIREILVRRKVPLRGNPRVYDRDKIRLELKTMSVAQVARRHGCSERFIYKLKREESQS